MRGGAGLFEGGGGGSRGRRSRGGLAAQVKENVPGGFETVKAMYKKLEVPYALPELLKPRGV